MYFSAYYLKLMIYATKKKLFKVKVITFVETVRSGSSDDFSIELSLTANKEKIFTTAHDAHSTASGDNITIEATLEIPYVYSFSSTYFYLFFNLIFVTQGRSQFVVA